VIGVLHSASPDPRSGYWGNVAAFRSGLSETGFSEGQGVTFEYRWAENQFDRLPALAGELVQRRVSLIFAGGGELAPLAAKKATSTIPIVFAIGSDPVEQGLVTSLARPGGNITGTTFLVVDLRPKLLDLIRDLLPKVSTVGILANPRRPKYQELLDQTVHAAQTRDLKVRIFSASNASEIDVAFHRLLGEPVEAMLILSDPVYFDRRDQLARLELQYRVPTVSGSRGFVTAGSLASYGAVIDDSYYQAGVYAARILKGENPADLPIIRPTKFELVINNKTAEALGITVPSTLLARADEVIE
jgi:putative ABC transport system substrate-binding protein